MPDSSIPSARLEQEAHTLGLRERTLPRSDIRSPQHLHILEFITHSEAGNGWCVAVWRGAASRLSPPRSNPPLPQQAQRPPLQRLSSPPPWRGLLDTSQRMTPASGSFCGVDIPVRHECPLRFMRSARRCICVRHIRLSCFTISSLRCAAFRRRLPASTPYRGKSGERLQELWSRGSWRRWLDRRRGFE